MHISLNLSFDIPIFFIQSGKSDELFQQENIEEDELILSTRKQEEIEAKILDIDLEVEKEEREIYSNLRLQHICEIVKIQASYRV